MKRKLTDADRDENLEAFLLKTDPKDVAKLYQEGLMPSKSGDRVDRSMMDKTLQQVQKEKLDKLMERIDTPLEEELREYTEYRAVRENERPRKEGSGVNDYHVYRGYKKKEATRKLVTDKQEEVDQLKIVEDERRQGVINKQNEITAKKRAKRLKRKDNRKSEA